MKRTSFISFLLALAICLSLVPTALADEPATLTIVVTRSVNDTIENFADKHWVAAAEEATGVKVNWIDLTEGQHSEQLAVMLAGDMPDAFFIGYNMSDSMVVQNTSLFVPLNDLIEKYAPNIYKLYEEDVPGWRDFLTYPDGNIYGLMSGAMSADTHKVQATQWINAKWLENLGLEMPTTLDEFYDVLVAFRDGDADGDGDTDNEIPLDFCHNHYAGNITNYAVAFGLPIQNDKYYQIIDGEVVGAVDTPEFREFLETMYEWGAEGLINVEGLSQTQEQYYANLDAMKVGTFHGWAPYTYISTVAKLQYESMVPYAAEGYIPSVNGNNPIRANRNGFVITTACKNVEAALKFYDYLCQRDVARFVFRGEEGVLWVEADNGDMIAKQPTDEELLAAGYDKLVGITNDTTLGNYIGYNNHYPLILKGLAADLNDPTANITVRTLAVNKMLPYIDESMSQAIVTAEQQKELDFATDGLSDMIKAFIADSVLNGVTDESWDVYIDNLDIYGYETYIDWYNRLYTGTF